MHQNCNIFHVYNTCYSPRLSLLNSHYIRGHNEESIYSINWHYIFFSMLMIFFSERRFCSSQNNCNVSYLCFAIFCFVRSIYFSLPYHLLHCSPLLNTSFFVIKHGRDFRNVWVNAIAVSVFCYKNPEFY